MLKLDKELDTKWYNAYKDLCSSILNFVLQRVDTVGVWSGKEPSTGAEEFFKTISQAAISGQALPASATTTGASSLN